MSMVTLILVDCWQWTPFVFIIVFARLQALPQDVFEAAQVDGAGPFATFRRITLPMLMPAIVFAAVFRAVDAFRSFDLIYGLSYGGPARSTTTLAFFSFQNGFQFQNYGYAAAVAYMMLIILARRHDGAAAATSRSGRGRRDEHPPGRVIAYLFLIVLGIVGAAPFLYLAVLSTKKRIEILAQVPPTLNFNWAQIVKNYNEVLFSQGMLSFTLNSVIVVGTATADRARHRHAGRLRLLAPALPRQRATGEHHPVDALHAADRGRHSALPDGQGGRAAGHLSGPDPALRRVLAAAGRLDHDRLLRRDSARDRRGRDDRRLHAASACCGTSCCPSCGRAW